MKDKPLYQTVAAKIEKLVADGVFPVGSRLPAERELAERFSVSRVTIREAEIALQALGLLNIKTGSGVYVLDSKSKNGTGFPDVTAFELTEARALFEAEAAALAAEEIDDATLEVLESLVEIMANTGPDDEEGELADKEFHRVIAAASGNTAITYLIETMWSMRTNIAPVNEVYASVCSENFGARAAEHTAILDALRARDPGAARIAMRAHFARLLKSMLDVTEEQALEEIRKKASETRQRYLKNATF